MSDFWFRHQFGIIVFLSVLLLVALSNWRSLRRLSGYRAPSRLPTVSVLVPARDEERNVGACVRSLLAQEYPDLEVLVLDDDSQDGTWRILEGLAATDARLKVLRGAPLPAGWVGKHWACHQLSRAARGELLLFTDADTRHHPHALRQAVAALLHEEADLLSALPKEEAASWAERLLVPLMPWSIFSFLPISLAHRLRAPALSANVGQFMLFRRQVYEEVGGHAAVKGDVVDDLALGRLVKARGGRWRLVDGTEYVRCRMYHNFREVWAGFSKSLFGAFGYNPFLFVFVWLWLGLVFLEPPVVLALWGMGVGTGPFSPVLAAVAIGASIFSWGLTHWRFGFPRYLALLYPLTVSLAVVVALRSLVLTWTGRAMWKGRALAAISILRRPVEGGAAPSDPPAPHARAGLRALRALARERSLLAALQALHEELGDVFRLSLPGFRAVVLVGPEANHLVAVRARDRLAWRMEGDPVVALFGHGVLVTDGEEHDDLRRHLSPPLHRRMLPAYVGRMRHYTDVVSASWAEAAAVDMLTEMRRITLLALMDALFKVDFRRDLDRLWPAILRAISYISPGLWILARRMPRPGYNRPLRELDAYLYRLIRERRASGGAGDDLLSLMVASPKMSDDLIRDQLLTMMIAGHDTCTALLAWSLYLLGKHPGVMARAQEEVDAVLGGEPPDFPHLERLAYLGQVVKETLRLYPPIHTGNRMTRADLECQGYRIPAGTRILYSIYLTHRHRRYWPEPDRFDPDRFAPGRKGAHVPYAFVPFGGGPRNCIGAAFAEVEAKVVLARILQRFDLQLLEERVRLHMGATLEPRPGVIMRARRRKGERP